MHRILFASLFALGVLSPAPASANCYGTGGVSQSIGIGTSYSMAASPIYDVDVAPCAGTDIFNDVGIGCGSDIVQQLPVVVRQVQPVYIERQVVVQQVPVVARQAIVQRSYVGSGLSCATQGASLRSLGYGTRFGTVGYGVGTGVGGINQNIGLGLGTGYGVGTGVGGINQSVVGAGFGGGRGRAVNTLRFRRNGTLRKAKQRARGF